MKLWSSFWRWCLALFATFIIAALVAEFVTFIKYGTFMSDLVAKYDIPTHLNNLNDRYPIGDDFLLRGISKNDEDFKYILAFRRECDKNERHKTRKLPHGESRVIFNWRRHWILAQIMEGQQLKSLAKKIGIPHSSLKKFVSEDEVLSAAFQVAKHKRQRLTDRTVFNINKLTERGYSPAAIAKRLGIKEETIARQIEKRKQAGLM